jgi:hypothetical protein
LWAFISTAEHFILIFDALSRRSLDRHSHLRLRGGRLRRESRLVWIPWIPVLTGMTEKGVLVFDKRILFT